MARDKDEQLFVYGNKPIRATNMWREDGDYYHEIAANHLIGKGPTWEDEPRRVYLGLHSPEQINELVGAAKDTLDGIKRENEKTGKHDDTPYQMEDMVYDLTKALKLFTGVE